MTNRLLTYISKPKTAFLGAAIFACFWFVVGAYNDYFSIQMYDDLVDKKYLPWKSDILGHFLSITTLLASVTFWSYDEQVEEMINGGEGFKKKKSKTLNKWLLICTLVCTAMAFNNFYYVSFLSETKEHWHHLLLPYYLPATMAFLYYIVAIIPLFMSLISFGYNINYCVEAPEGLKGFSVTDENRCFGISYLGNSLFLISFFIFIIMSPAIAIQFIQKNKITLGSLIMIPFALYLLYMIVIKPGLKLSNKLATIKRERECSIREEIDALVQRMTASRDDSAKFSVLNQRLKLISTQKIVPTSKPFAIGGYYLLAPTIAFSVLGSMVVWIDSILEVIKKL